MFPKIDAKKMQDMMKKMGMSQQQIDADRVIIEKSDNQGKIIIENPSVIKINMQGQENFQISGDVTETEGEENEEQEIEEAEEQKSEEQENIEEIEQDIKTIMEKTGKDKAEVALCLEKNNGDIAQTIIELSEE